MVVFILLVEVNLSKFSHMFVRYPPFLEAFPATAFDKLDNEVEAIHTTLRLAILMPSFHNTEIIFLTQGRGLLLDSISEFGDPLGYLLSIAIEVADGAFFCVDEKSYPVGSISAVGVKIEDDTDLRLPSFYILSQ